MSRYVGRTITVTAIPPGQRRAATGEDSWIGEFRGGLGGRHVRRVRPQQLRAVAVGIQVDPAVQVLAEDGEQRLVAAPVRSGLDRRAQVDPDAIWDRVAVVVDIPGTIDGIKGGGGVAARKVGMVGDRRPQDHSAVQSGIAVPCRAPVVIHPVVHQCRPMQRRQHVHRARIGPLDQPQQHVLVVGRVPAFVRSGHVHGDCRAVAGEIRLQSHRQTECRVDSVQVAARA